MEATETRRLRNWVTIGAPAQQVPEPGLLTQPFLWSEQVNYYSRYSETRNISV